MNNVFRGAQHLIICLLLLLTIGQSALAQTSAKQKGGANPQLDAQQYMEMWGAAMKELQMYYVDSIDFKKILTAGIDGMLEGLDPYTEFFNEEDQSEFKTMTTGEYGGIGALIMQRGDTVCISAPYEGQPAVEVGLRPGDGIISIDGENMLKKTTAEVSEKLRGTPGTSFKLVIQRPYKQELRTIDIVRRKIELPAVPYYGWVNDSIAYISLSSFTEKAGQEVQSALLALRQQKPVSGVILDLRNNGGGLLNEAVKIVNFFVPKGETVVETKAKLPQWNSTYKTSDEPIDTQMRIAVLVNRGTASASEIVSGALQDMDRAVVMGERTFGKGLVQSTRPLPYNTLLKFTSAKYYIPSGRCIQAIDYSRSNEDGSVGRIPDSLTHVFTTRGGREVRDGGGIKPDVEKKPQQLSNLAFYLDRGNYIFDFATRYRNDHESIGDLQQFSITDADYADFCEMLKARNFTYDRLSSKKLKELRELAALEGYSEEAKAELDALDAKLGHNLDHDLQQFKPEVTGMLNQEIAARYYYQNGLVQQSLLSDSLCIEATALLADPARYHALLQPVVKPADTQSKATGKKAKAAATKKEKSKSNKK